MARDTIVLRYHRCLFVYEYVSRSHLTADWSYGPTTSYPWFFLHPYSPRLSGASLFPRCSIHDFQQWWWVEYRWFIVLYRTIIKHILIFRWFIWFYLLRDNVLTFQGLDAASHMGKSLPLNIHYLAHNSDLTPDCHSRGDWKRVHCHSEKYVQFSPTQRIARLWNVYYSTVLRGRYRLGT